MSRISPLAFGGSIILLAAFASAAPAAADSVESGLLGAWTLSASDCATIFEPRDGALSFRQPADQFAQAIIIQPDQILGPAAVCRIDSVSHDSSGAALQLECRDSISFLARKVHVRALSNTEIVYSPSNDPALDTTYTKCPL